jgi:methylmalonyl-CoA/ethylmalonyl-CoA epimerase
MESLKVPLDHVAIAVSDIEKSVKFYETLGIKFRPEREVVDSQKVMTAFGKIGEHANLELLAPTSDDSTIAKFIREKGPGIHHLCFKVDNLVEKQKELEAQGYSFTAKTPFKGAHNCLVNFIHPKSSGGVLIELSQGLE